MGHFQPTAIDATMNEHDLTVLHLLRSTKKHIYNSKTEELINKRDIFRSPTSNKTFIPSRTPNIMYR